MKNLILITLLFFLACAHAESDHIEPLMGAQVQSENIVLQVFTGGCTNKNSFVINTRKNIDTLEVTFLRVIPDNCEAYLPNGRFLLYELEELGIQSGQTVKIMNPFIFK
jgi:hypothetical protein